MSVRQREAAPSQRRGAGERQEPSALAPVNEGQYGKSKLQSVQLYALDTLEENHVRERKGVSCSHCPAGDGNIVPSSNRFLRNACSAKSCSASRSSTVFFPASRT